MFEVDKHWEPDRDEDGKAVPITYHFCASNGREESVGDTRTVVEDRPAVEEILRKEASLLAIEVAEDNAGEHPWVGWQVNVIADDLYDGGPYQVGFFRFPELLNL